MLSVNLSSLLASQLYSQVVNTYKEYKLKLDALGIPLLDIYTTYELKPTTVKMLFENFNVAIDLYGSTEAFYSALQAVNYFIVTYEYLIKNNIEFSNFILSSEDLIIINNFKLLKDTDN